MVKYKTAKELFLPLAERLLLYEDKSYHFETYDSKEFGQFYTDYDYQSVIQSILRDSNLLDEGDVLQEVNKYKTRVQEVLKHLTPKKFEYVKGEKVKINKEKQELFFERWQAELNTYIYYLNILTINCELVLKYNKLISAPYIYNLPENFKAPNITEHFRPSLTNEQVALLLYYLKELQFIPPYNDLSLSTLATPLFGVGTQGVRTSFINIHTIKSEKKTRVSLKKILTSLLEKLDQDIK